MTVGSPSAKDPEECLIQLCPNCVVPEELPHRAPVMQSSTGLVGCVSGGSHSEVLQAGRLGIWAGWADGSLLWPAWLLVSFLATHSKKCSFYLDSSAESAPGSYPGQHV